MKDALEPEWWRGYRGCKSPPELGGEANRQLELYPPAIRDRRKDRVVRQVPLLISHQQPNGIAAQEACRRDLDVLIDACGPERVLIRHLSVRTAVTAGVLPGNSPVTATLRLSVYLIEELEAA
jgi:hypothetical protein